MSLPLLVSLRKYYHGFKKLDQFFNIIQWVGDKNSISMYLLVAYNFMDLPKSFTLAICTYSGVALLCFLKSVNNEPRPFHVSSDLIPSYCRLEYGNPSGHALLTTSMYLTFWKMMCLQYDLKARGFLYNISLFLVLAMILIVGFTRIYHGVHTLNQIFGGWMWGTALYYLFSRILHFEICKFTNSVAKMSWRQLLFNFATRNFLFIYVVLIVIYYAGNIVYPVPIQWLDNISKNCEDLSS